MAQISYVHENLRVRCKSLKCTSLSFSYVICDWLQDYLTNDNDQAVVEICITRITTAIRETGSIERHGAALVSLWESCLEHNLQPQGKDEDTPHAKIASDITSCILQVGATLKGQSTQMTLNDFPTFIYITADSLLY